MRTNQQSRQTIVRISTLITLAVIVLLGCSQHALGQWATSGNDISNTNSGNVGVGTTTPVSQLHVATESTTAPRGITSSQHSADNNGFLFTFRKSRGTRIAPAAALNGDNIGNLYAEGYDGASYISGGRIRFAIDGTVASGSVPTAVQFFSGSNGSGIERMRINSAGNVGIGTTNPLDSFHLYSTNNNVGTMRIQGGNTYAGFMGMWDGGPTLLLTNNRHPGTGSNFNTGVGGVQISLGTQGAAGDTMFFTTSSGISGVPLELMRIRSNGNVGIGTSTPNFKLDLQGGQINASGGLCIAGDCKTAWSQVGGAGSSQWTTSGSSIYYNSGYVGLGTTAPGNKLEIVEANSPSASSIRVLSGSPSAYAGYAIGRTGTEGYWGIAGTAGHYATGSAPGDVIFRAETNLILSNLGAPTMYLKSNGNVGVGTTAPTAQLHVVGANGPANNTAAPAPDALQVSGGVGGSGTWGASPGGVGGAINLSGGTGGTPVAGSTAALGGKGGTINLAGGNGGPNVFGVGGGAGGDVLINGGAGVANSAGNVILANLRGNVGVGTSSPGYRLDVQGGQLNAAGGLCIAGDCKTAWSQVGGGSGSQWTSSGANIYYNAGSVGIGTTTPSAALLHLQSASNSYLRIGAPLASQSSIAFNDDSNGQDIVLYRRDNTRDFTIWTATASNVFNVTQAGSVGIGTTAPAYKLDVNGEINATGLRINGTPISTGGSSQWTTSGSTIYYNAGNVGIGTASPAFDANAAKYLTVDAGAAAIGSIGAAGGTGSLGTAVSQVAFVNSSLGTADKRLATIVGSTDTATNSGMLDFYTASAGAFSSPRMRMTSGGNVGIGSTTPGAKLDVAGTIRGGNADTNIGNHPSYGTAYGAFWRQGADYSLLTDGSNTFLNAPVATGNVYFRSANTDKMFLQGSTGNVGIGTTAPATKLHVVGDITVTGNIAAKYQDVAEWVESSQQLRAGTVVVLDATQSNQVIASTQAYDTRVAGVISERPGLVLGESGTNKVLVATTGRVKIKVDATLAPIGVGDLLVTGNQPGVAMKSQPLDFGGVQIHRPGTLIGKALEPLAKGQGEILVLLSLQ